MRKTIIETATGNVINVIVLADGAEWKSQEGQQVGQDGGEIGQRWNGSAYEWINPPVHPSEPSDP
jgi:hypothetical protein